MKGDSNWFLPLGLLLLIVLILSSISKLELTVVYAIKPQSVLNNQTTKAMEITIYIHGVAHIAQIIGNQAVLIS